MTANIVDWWLIVGFSAQLCFGLRFLLQWVASERIGKSVIPVGFWWLSICGSILLLAYAIYRRDPVFIAGQGFAMAVYLRNLHLILRPKDAVDIIKADSPMRLRGKIATIFFSCLYWLFLKELSEYTDFDL